MSTIMITHRTLLLSLLLFFLFCALLNGRGITALQCIHSFPAKQTTFDISALTHTVDSYRSQYYVDNAGEKFFYTFNVCDNLATIPVTNPPYKCGNRSAAAFQVYVDPLTNATGSKCFVLGYSEQTTWKLLDLQNGALGVQLIYGNKNGVLCSSNHSRTFTVNLYCAPSQSVTPTREAVETENLCTYEVTFESVHGCPLECPRDDSGEVCSKQGICSFDTSTNSPHCFCNTGKIGADCSLDIGSGGSSVSINTVLVSVVLSLLFILIVIAVFLYRKIKKLRSEDNIYGALNDDPVEEE